VVDVYNKILNGECLEEMKKLPDNCVDMILTDPPYGTTACKWDSIIPLEPMWVQLKRLIKDNGVIVMTASRPFTTTLIASNMEMFKYCWVWEKSRITGVLNAKKQPLRCIEDIVVFYDKQCTYNPQGIIKCNRITSTGDNGKGNSDNYGKVKIGKYKQTQTRYPNQILKFKSEIHTVHPTQKPVALMEYLINTYTNKGETVLDFTMGSGTTGVACKKLKRNFIGIELDKKYYDIAVKRIKDVRIGTLDRFMKRRKKR
jgi:site-specific DNA-methyltransferase (adenine-specific)